MTKKKLKNMESFSVSISSNGIPGDGIVITAESLHHAVDQYVAMYMPLQRVYYRVAIKDTYESEDKKSIFIRYVIESLSESFDITHTDEYSVEIKQQE